LTIPSLFSHLVSPSPPEFFFLVGKNKREKKAPFDGRMGKGRDGREWQREMKERDERDREREGEALTCRL
jgi:hypothetical protein